MVRADHSTKRNREKMLSSIHIKNYKTHLNLLVNLTEGLNCILAPSNRGKSAIISACNWLIDNKPSGLSFRSWGCKPGDLVSVIFNFNNGDCIIREKNEFSEQEGGIDRYTLIVNGNESVFDRVNKTVPDEVSNYLNLSYYNVKTQFAPFFLLQDSPGDVGRKFNEVVGLDIIDVVIKNAKGYVKKTKDEYEKADKEIKRLTKEISELDCVDEYKKEIDVLEVYNKEYLDRYSVFEKVVDIVDSHVYKILEDIKEYETLIHFENDIDTLIEEITVYNESKERVENVKDLIDEIYELQREIDECERIIFFENDIDELVRLEESKWGRKARISEIDDLVDEIGELEEQVEEYEKLIKFEKDINELIKLEEELLDRQDIFDEIIDLRDDILSAVADIRVAEDEIEECQYKYEEIIQQGGICPTCKTVLTEEQLRNIEL